MKREELMTDATKNYKEEIGDILPKKKRLKLERMGISQNIVVEFYNKDKKSDDRIIWAEPLINSYMSINEMISEIKKEGFKEEDIRNALKRIGVSNISNFDTASAYSMLKSKL